MMLIRCPKCRGSISPNGSDCSMCMGSGRWSSSDLPTDVFGSRFKKEFELGPSVDRLGLFVCPRCGDRVDQLGFCGPCGETIIDEVVSDLSDHFAKLRH